MEYIQAAKEEEEGGCIFCELPSEPDDEASRIVARADLAFVLLNRFPYNPGHLLVAPYRHVGELGELTAEESVALHELLARSIDALTAEMEPHGFNIGMNLGRVAGAGIPDHVHWHVVPRWGGDSNFMPVIGQTKVLPELLEETRRRLAPRFAS